MHILYSVVAIITGLMLVVGLHELGHALSARFFGVKILRISIGFGKPLLSWQLKSGPELVFAVLPLGGYVHLLNSRIAPVTEAEKKNCFDKQPFVAKLIILFSGVLANLLVAFIAFTCYLLIGYQQQLPVVSSVMPASIAARAGLHPEDQIVGIAGHSTATWYDASAEILIALGKQDVSFKVANAGRTHIVKLDLRSVRASRQKRSLYAQLGLVPNLSKQYLIHVPGISLAQALPNALIKVAKLANFFIMMIKQIVIGNIHFSTLLGPLEFFHVVIISFFQGVAVFLYFIANLSIAVGVVNLIPLPGLDGGSMVYALLEKIRGKPLSIAWEILLYRLIKIAFCLVIVQLLLNDLQYYIK